MRITTLVETEEADQIGPAIVADDTAVGRNRTVMSTMALALDRKSKRRGMIT